MQFYPSDFRSGTLPVYPQNFIPPTAYRIAENPLYYPNQYEGSMNPYYFSNQFYGNQMQPYYNPYQQAQLSRFGRLPDTFNTIMGHAGTITSGINMVRQIGAIMSMFR
ncbi:hypothetical protein [Lysinibacillus sp. 54212]|uniref:hypothetical protein n=1 Tax=Lysinibacillus sp. 54212 TaxID=3119829 RepID=UPI002FCBD0E1